MSQRVLDPRQIKALNGYKNPASDTFGSLRGSLIKAGYDDEYANSIGGRNPAWLTENVDFTINAIKQAEKNLQNVLNVGINFNSEDYDIDLARLQTDVSKFILKSLAKTKYESDEEKAPPAINVNLVNYHDIKEASILPDEEIKSIT